MALRAAEIPAAQHTHPGFRAVGRVGRSWGLQGHVRVQSLTDFPERFAPGARVFIDEQPYAIEACHWQRRTPCLLLSGVRSPEAADALRGRLLEVPDAEHPAFSENEFYVDDVEGCRVETLDGTVLGTVREVLQPGANDVYVVERGARRDLLVPAIRSVVLRVDVPAQRIVVDLPPGLDPDEGN